MLRNLGNYQYLQEVFLAFSIFSNATLPSMETKIKTLFTE